MVSIREMAKRYKRPVEEFARRSDGAIMWYCLHGVGHVVYYPDDLVSCDHCDGCCDEIGNVEVVDGWSL